MSRISVVIACLLIAVPAPCVAQGQAETDRSIRSRARGRVLDKGGRPWVGAEIVFASRAIAGERQSSLDVVRTRSDARGRFAVALLPGRRYDAWASTRLPTGDVRISGLVTAAGPGRVVTIREERVRRPTTFRFGRRDAWRDREPLRFGVMLDAKSLYTEFVEVVEDGTAVMPCLPGVGLQLLVEDRDGSIVQVRQFGEQELSTAVPGGVRETALPERFPLVVKIRATGAAAPDLAGVAIYQRIARVQDRDVWGFAGRTEKDGRASVKVVKYQVGNSAAARQYVWLRAWGKKLPVCQGGRSLVLQQPEKNPIRKAGRPDIQITAAMPVRTLKGRLLMTEGEPLAGRRLLFYDSIGNRNSMHFNFMIDPQVVETDSEGRFEFHGLGARSAYRLVAELTEADAKRLSQNPSCPVATIALLDTAVVQHGVDLGEVRLDRLSRFDCEVRRPDGFPSAGAEFHLGEYGSRVSIRVEKGQAAIKQTCMLQTQLPLRVSADRRGRFSLLMPDTKTLSGVALQDDAFATTSVAVTGAATGPWRPFQLSMAAMISFRGRIVNSTGKPVPGAIVQVSPSRYPKGFDARLAALLVTGRMVKTDADGKFRVGLPFREIPYYVYARFLAGNRWFASQGRQMIETDENGVVEDAGGYELVIPVPDIELGEKPEVEKKSDNGQPQKRRAGK